MVELELLRSGQSSATYPVSLFPCLIGRSRRCDVRLTEPGVWDEHAVLSLATDGRFRIERRGEGSLTLQGEPVTEGELHTSDIIDLGGTRLRFRLAPVQPPPQVLADWILWGCIVAVVATMIGLMLTLPG